jgi:chromosome segregation ATPase
MAFTELLDLEDAGFTRQQVQGLARLLDKQLASKDDLRNGMSELRAEMAELKGELRAEMAEPKSELRAEIANVGERLSGQISALAVQVSGLSRTIYVVAIGLAGLMVALRFLPPAVLTP